MIVDRIGTAFVNLGYKFSFGGKTSRVTNWLSSLFRHAKCARRGVNGVLDFVVDGRNQIFGAQLLEHLHSSYSHVSGCTVFSFTGVNQIVQLSYLPLLWISFGITLLTVVQTSHLLFIVTLTSYSLYTTTEVSSVWLLIIAIQTVLCTSSEWMFYLSSEPRVKIL